jgi:hypothetical protein
LRGFGFTTHLCWCIAFGLSVKTVVVVIILERVKGVAIVFDQVALNDILINLDTEGFPDDQGDARVSNAWIAAFELNNGLNDRSAVERFGARRRARVSTSRCCLRRRFSAMMDFTPPGPMNFATVVSSCTSRMNMSFILGQGRVSKQGRSRLHNVPFSREN